MFNLAEHEILNAHKYKNIRKYEKEKKIIQAQIKPRMLFFLPIKVEMPRAVGISTFVSICQLS